MENKAPITPEYLKAMPEADLLAQIGKLQDIQKTHRSTSSAWLQASELLKPLFDEMARRHPQAVTTPENLALINVAFAAMEKQMAYLYGRWLDEKEYEDFADYETDMKTKLLVNIPDAVDVQGSKKPFGFSFSLDSKKYQFRISGKGYEWKRIG